MTEPMELRAADVEAMDEERTREVLAAWVKARRTELPEALARSPSKPHARAAKKALYQLKSVGVAVNEPERAAEPKATPLPALAQDLPAVMSAFLGTGERAIFFARPVRGGGLDLYQGILNDSSGVMQLDRGESNRGTWRKRMRQLEHDQDLKVLAMPWERMRAELGRALAMNERTATALPKDVDGLLRRLGVEPLDPDVALPPPEPTDAALAAQGASLHREKEIGEWLPSEAHLKILTARLDEVTASPLSLSDAQRHQQRELKVVATANELVAGDTRAVYARRLWYMAELFDASQRVESAKIARAEARRLFHDTQPSAFAEQLFRKVLELMPPAPREEAAGAPPQPAGLIVP